MALNAQAQLRVANAMCRFLSRRREAVAFTRPEIQAAVSPLDAFLDSNATAINNSLPAAFRSTATTQQEALLLAIICLIRYDPVVAARFLGELD